MGGVKVRLGQFDHQTLKALEYCIAHFADTATETVGAISKFIWLWPCFEAKRCNKIATTGNLNEFANRLATIQMFGNDDYKTTAQYFLDR